MSADRGQSQLKPCPFCGFPDHIVTEAMGEFWVHCEHCGGGSDMASNEDDAIKRWNSRAVPLAEKHTGMMVSLEGLISRIVRGEKPDKGQRYMLAEFLKHLKQTSDAYYEGNVSVVDELFQLYAIADKRPK